MPASHVQVAPDSTGKDIDADSVTSTEAGTPTVYRQDIVIADPVTYANKAHVGPGGDQLVSLTTPSLAPFGVTGALTPYGALQVLGISPVLFSDPMDGPTVDTASRWSTGGTQLPTQANGTAVLAATVGASVSNNSTLVSQVSFSPSALGFTLGGGLVTLESAQVSAVNVNRFWGFGQVTSFTYATPVTDGIGFEVEGTLGALQCVIWVGGVKYVLNSTSATLISSSVAGAGGSGTALPSGSTGSNFGSLMTWQGGEHRYAVEVRPDVIYWFVENTNVPVAVLTYAAPSVQTLPIRFAAITNGSATSLPYTFQAGAVTVADTGGQNQQVSDGTYPWRKATVTAGGALSTVANATRTQMAWGTVTAGLTAGTSATNALIVLGQEFRGGVSAGTTNTSNAITAGKTFRVTAMTVALQANAALVSSAVFTLLYNPAGAVTTASAPALVATASVPAVTGTMSSATVPVPDGLDLPGGTTPGQFGIAVLPTWATTAPQVYAWITGYEY